MQQTSEIYKELLEAQQLGDPNVKFQTRLTIGEPGVLITKQGDSITFGSKAYTKTAAGSTIVLTETEDRPLKGLKVFGKTTQNGIPTPDAPVPLETVGADGSVDVTACGKNLLRYPYRHKTFTTNGITFTDNGDGSVTANGTATANAYFNLDFTSTNLKPGHEYIASSTGDDSTSLHLNITYFKADGTYANACEWVRTPKHFTVPSDYVKTRAFLCILKGGTANNITAYPMLRHVSATDESYKPYAGHTLSISTPNGLPGIPVTSGGNYTDESGQQWICDEVDFEKGVYVQRVVLSKLTSTMNWKYSTSTKRFYTVISNAKADYSYRKFIGLCSHYPAGVQDKNVAISYINEGNEGVAIRDESRFSGDMNVFKSWLDTNDVWVCTLANRPIETALSAEQLAAFALLHTNAPNTTVFNDSGAYTEIKYTMNGDGPSRILTGVSGADSGYDETVLISMETDARVFSEDTPEVGASISSQIDIEMIKPFAELPKQARLVPYVRLSDGLRHSEWIQKGVFYIDTRSKIEDGSSIEKIVLHGYDDMLKAEQDYPESTLSWPAKDLDVVREIAEFIGVAVDDRTVSIMNRGYTIQYPTGYSCRDVLGYIAAMYAGSFIMSDLGDLRLVTIYGIPKETRYLIEPNGYVITFGGDRILV